MEKKILQLIYSTLLVVLCSCTNNPQVTQKISQSQDYLDSLFKAEGWGIVNSDREYWNVKGDVRKISYEKIGEGFYFPIKSVEFDIQGEVQKIEYINEYGDTIPVFLFQRKGDKCINFDTEDLYAEFTINEKGKKLTTFLANQFGGITYNFEYSKERFPVLINTLDEYLYDPENEIMKRIQRKYTTNNVEIDGNENWSAIYIHSNENQDLKIKRYISYFPNPTIIPTNCSSRIFCYTQNEYSTLYIRYYDVSTKKWNKLVPPEYEIEGYGYKDYKIIGDHLYVMLLTGACGAGVGSACDIKYYDLSENLWHDVIMCGDECEFIDEKIKAPIWKIVKEGKCSAENEYEVSIQWIELN